MVERATVNRKAMSSTLISSEFVFKCGCNAMVYPPVLSRASTTVSLNILLINAKPKGINKLNNTPKTYFKVLRVFLTTFRTNLKDTDTDT